MLRSYPILIVAMLGTLALAGCGREANRAPGTKAVNEIAPALATSPQTAPIGESRYAMPAEGAVADFAVPAAGPTAAVPFEGSGPGQSGDKFDYVAENRFELVKDTPLSTFSIDVDTAAYSKVRAYLLQSHSLPPKDAVRIEELINYFDYDYAGPKDEHPFAVHLETAGCPWAPLHRLVRLGIQGKQLDNDRPSSNLVFLIDVSGSMDSQNKLPLVQRSLELLTQQLGENDRVSIVVYAGAAGLVLPPTSGDDRQKILSALGSLRAGGSTNGGQGIHLAYNLAEENFIKGGVNRVILCSDGDFNVGTTSTGDLVRLAIDKSQSGVLLSVLGFGVGNHNDAMLEQIADKANGNYAFIDSEAEARKVLVEQMQGTLVTIAKDVKMQFEFNPAKVAAYRLIGYENRRLADRDFNDDAKDAGDIGAGHRVTVLYELIPVGQEGDLAASAGIDPLKYQPDKNEDQPNDASAAKSVGNNATAGELLTLKMRYQPPAGGASTLMTFPLKDAGESFAAASSDFQFATAVAAFGMLLRDSKYRGDIGYPAVQEIAAAAKGVDKFGYRAEFLESVQEAQRLGK
jgi:Ca-activated chloride channel family protein